MHSVLSKINKSSTAGLSSSKNYTHDTIAVVTDKKNDFKVHEYINCDEKSKFYNCEYDDNSNEAITPLPSSISKKRFVLFCYGGGGNGKTLINLVIACYYAKITGNKIYYFTNKIMDINDDETFKPYLPHLKNFIKVDLDHLDYENLNYMQFKNSLCLFDDNDNVNDKRKLFKLINTISEVGRSANISLIVISHSPTIANFAREYMSDIKYILTFYDSLKLDENGKTHNRLFKEYFPNINLNNIIDFKDQHFLFINMIDNYIIGNSLIKRLNVN